MKKLFLSMITIISLAGISLAGNCNDHQQVTMADSKPVLLLKISEMKMIKYANGGMMLYSVKKFSGETVAENLNSEQLSARFPEIVQNLEG